MRSPTSLLGGQAGRLFERRARRSERPIGLVLVHHEIAPAGDDRGGGLLPPLPAELFDSQLVHLRRHYDVVELQELPQRAAQRKAGEPIPVAITFDDDLARHLSVAAPILERHGMPATFFLSGNCLRRPSRFWWQDLEAIAAGGADALADLRRRLGERWPWARIEGSLTELADTIEQADPDERDEVAALLREAAGPIPAQEGLSAEGIGVLSGRGFEIGFHTLRHYALTTLDAKGLEQAMRDGVEELARAAGARPRAIAYPHGKANLRVADAAQRAGFELGFTGDASPVSPRRNPLLLPRVSAWSSSDGAFAWGLGRVASA